VTGLLVVGFRWLVGKFGIILRFWRSKSFSSKRLGLEVEVPIPPGEISPNAYFDKPHALQISIFKTAW
jgi:hypothetical protein